MSNAVADLKARKGELKSAWDRLDKANDEIMGSAPIDNGVLTIDNGRRAQFQKNLSEMMEIKGFLGDVDKQIELKEWGAQPAAGQLGWQADQASFGGSQLAPGSEYKTLGQMFTDSEEFKALVKGGGAQMNAPYVFPGAMPTRAGMMGSKYAFSPGMEQKDVYSAAPTGGPPLGFKPLYREDVVVQAFRKVRVRDLFPVQPTTAAVIEYFRVTGFTASNNASTTPERLADNSNFAIAPHTSLQFAGVQSPIRLINHWEAAHRNVLNDVPQLQGVIDTELLYGLRLAEDNQILNGTGNGEDVLGLLNTPSVQTYLPKTAGTAGSRTGGGAGFGTDTKVDDVRRAATKAILAYYEPTGVVMHPTDWETIETTKDSTGAYIIAIAVAMGSEQRVWRLPVVDTPAIAQGTSLVGSFGLGAKLYDRMEGTIRVAEQHADFFLRSAIVVLAEERITVTVPRPESFVAITFGP